MHREYVLKYSDRFSIRLLIEIVNWQPYAYIQAIWLRFISAISFRRKFRPSTSGLVSIKKRGANLSILRGTWPEPVNRR